MFYYILLFKSGVDLDEAVPGGRQVLVKTRCIIFLGGEEKPKKKKMKRKKKEVVQQTNEIHSDKRWNGFGSKTENSHCEDIVNIIEETSLYVICK